MNRTCITFAGAVGSSKTPIANYLSTSLNLPVLNNDAIRTEVTEDLLNFNVEVYNQRQEARCKALLATGHAFIYDASVDRKWPTFNKWLQAQNYQCFIISLDLSHEWLIKLYKAKNYKDLEALPTYMQQHTDFVTQYSHLIGATITDDTFADRLAISLESVHEWIN